MTVKCPRVMQAKYWPLPWSIVVAAASRGDDGLGPVTAEDWALRDWCFLREGDKFWPADKTILFQQNW